MIKLTTSFDRSGVIISEPVYINQEHIVSIEVLSNSTIRNHSQLFLITGKHISVNETPDEILKLLDERYWNYI